MSQIIYGDDHVAAELTYGPRSDGLIQALRDNLSFSSPLLTEQGRAYASYVGKVFESVSGWDAVRAVRRATQAIAGYVKPDIVTALDSLEKIQTAPPKMQRFLMANVELRKLYQAGRIDGYSESYIDIQPGAIGRDHYDYRVATHGVVQTKTGDDESIAYEVTQYAMELASWDEPLNQRQRLDLAFTYSIALANLIEGEEEPTSCFGGKL